MSLRLDADPARSSALLDQFESNWKPQLPGISLLTELEVDKETVAEVSRALGQLYRRKVLKGQHQSLFDRWPGCVAVAMSGVAAHDYREGTFWRYWWEAIYYQELAGQQDAKAWGQAFLNALRTFRLPLFSERSMRYVGPILMHAGIPTFCLERFFNLLLQRRSADPGLDADTLLAWAVGRENRLRGLHEPAQWFIRYGTDHAVDVIDRCFDLLDRLRAGDHDFDGLGLPARYLDQAQALFADDRLDPGHRTTTDMRPRRTERPRLAIDPFGQGVRIILPPVGDTPDGTARWSVTVDGVQSMVKSRSMWLGTAEAAPSTSYAIARPARVAQVSLYGAAHESEIGIVDSGDPLLIFKENGDRLSDHLAVPPDSVWLLHPDDREPVADVPLRTVVTGSLPIGWDGWRLVQVALEGATWIGLSGEQTRRRPVRGHSKPRVITGEPLTGVTTPYGSPVFSEPPAIWLPAETTTTWLVDVRPAAGGDSVFSDSFTVNEPTEVSDALWSEVSRPILGAFEITVRGPIGRSTRRTVFIAEGLTARFTPQVRLFTHGGLVAGQAAIEAVPGMAAEPALPTYSPAEQKHVVTCSAGHRSEPLIVAPPSMKVLTEERDQNPQWGFGPVRLVTESFDEIESLQIEVPGLSTLPPMELLVGGRSVQELAPAGRGRYSLKRAQDTIAQHRSAELVLPLAGRAIPIGSVRPNQLATGVSDQGDHLRLEGCVWVEGLTAGIYLCTAPWREAKIVTVKEDGSIPLPPDLVGAGPMHVRLSVESPWFFSEWPRWPHPREVIKCETAGQYGGADDEERLLSGYLAGANRLPEHVSRLDRLWTIVDLANRIDYPSAARRIEDCASLLRRHPESIRFLPDAALPPDRAIVALVTTGLAAAGVDNYLETDDRLWRRSPLVAALLTGPVLTGLAEDSDLLAEIEAECGESAAAILRGEGDPHPEAGQFDRFAELMDRRSPEELEQVWSNAQLVPASLLDRDTRVAAARQLFDERHRRDGRMLSAKAADMLREAMAIRVTEYRGLEQYIEARCHPQRRDGWVSLSAMSIACALIARVAARGHEGCQHLEREFRPLWRALSKIAPELTALDLIRAELLIAGRVA
ncbi:hypothetical protein PS9374_04177 [Planomonospora sphaerica]|uniref:Uncharacterized protein n=1 Tax=Planomonospora sphaerica TaxID=161355 RepID=A0A171DHI2_9ACTN|nr:hypothetical protein [Planomonospora sphaerica]GAT68512.1 hypothetical protein PS9374_04177 [Planomonospora sphaerica]